MAIIKRRNSDDAAETQTEETAIQLEGNENPESTESDEAKNPPKVRRRRIVKKSAESEKEETENTEQASSEPQENDSVACESSSEPQQMQSHHESSEANSDSAHEEHYVPRQRYDNNRRWNNNNRYGNRRYNNNRYNNTNYEKNLQARLEAVQAAQKIENLEEYESKPRLLINDLTKKSMPELRELGVQYGISADEMAPMKKQDLIFSILRAHTEHGGIIFASGALEILPDGYGFLRSPQNSYLPGPDDIYISPSQIRLFN